MVAQRHTALGGQSGGQQLPTPVFQGRNAVLYKRFQVCLCLSEHTDVSSHSTVTLATTIWCLLDAAGIMQQTSWTRPSHSLPRGRLSESGHRPPFASPSPPHPTHALRAREGGDAKPCHLPMCVPLWHLGQVTPLSGPQFPHRAWH